MIVFGRRGSDVGRHAGWPLAERVRRHTYAARPESSIWRVNLSSAPAHDADPRRSLPACPNSPCRSTGLTKVYPGTRKSPAEDRAERRRPGDSARLDLRPAGSQRGGQVDADQHPGRPGQQDRRARPPSGAATSTSGRATPAPPSAWCRRSSSPTSSSPRARRWRSRPASTACRRPSGAPTSCWPRWAWRDKADAYVRAAVGRHEAAADGGQGHGAQPAGADPRRADRRASTSSCAASSGTTSGASTPRA